MQYLTTEQMVKTGQDKKQIGLHKKLCKPI